MRDVGLIALLVAAGLGSPASSEDLSFRYGPSHLRALQAYNSQPYWAMLAECGGIYGALVNRYESQGQTQAIEPAKAEGVRFVRMAAAQLATDRGITQAEALSLVAARVETGRDAGVTMLSEPASSGLKHEQVIDMFCTQISDAHKSALRFSKR